MRHTVLAKAPGLDTPHPPAPDAPEVKLPDLHTADGEREWLLTAAGARALGWQHAMPG
jgi:hypothetical protein